MYSKNPVIFIVDDDMFSSKLIEKFIKEKFEGSYVTCYPTGEECLIDLYKKPDIIILDYQLDSITQGAMNGMQVLKKLIEQIPSVPVIFLSSQENPEFSANIIQLGAFNYILKGEHAIHKLEIVLHNALGKINLEKKLSSQKIFNYILLALFIACVAGIIVSKFS